MYRQETDGIEIRVRPHFLEEQSSPDDRHYVWVYYIEIQNNRHETVQLLNRKWQIIDAQGRQKQVEGEGVIGEQPLINSHDQYEYTSGVPLSTSSGIMGGAYEMEGADGQKFWVEIPTFSLDSPYSMDRMN